MSSVDEGIFEFIPPDKKDWHQSPKALEKSVRYLFPTKIYLNPVDHLTMM